MPMDAMTLNMPGAKIAEFCRRNHIRKLSLFGSVLRGDAMPESDVDFVVEFEPEATPGYFGLARMERELSEILGGRKVDLRTPGELSRYFRDEVLAQAKVQYAER
jgi:predicted nucleotidyltransferase